MAGEWPYLWLDATYLKVRAAGRIVSVAAIIAVAVNIDGRREIVGFAHRPVRGRGVLVGLPEEPQGPRPHRHQAGDIRRPRRVEGGDRPRPRRHLATLGALDPQCARLRAEGPAHHGRRRAAPGVPAAGRRSRPYGAAAC